MQMLSEIKHVCSCHSERKLYIPEYGVSPFWLVLWAFKSLEMRLGPSETLGFMLQKVRQIYDPIGRITAA